MHCLDFKNIFTQKFGETVGVCAQTTASFSCSNVFYTHILHFVPKCEK
jgi:hypothetical protein